MMWLGIDTANTPLSVALVRDGVLLAEYTSSMALNHSLRAMKAIEELFEKADVTPQAIDAIAVSEGPGSYTGVRIGVTIAKTLAWTLGKPLVGISSLRVMAGNALLSGGIICPLVDARRRHVYSAIYKSDGSGLQQVKEDGHYAIETLLESIKEIGQPVLFVGADISLYREEIESALGELASFAPQPFQLPRASLLIHFAEQEEQEEDLHAFVPEYRRVAEAEANWLAQQKKGTQS
ncbi:tRNA threonylcarbamoyladenosine biosynthesis protein TsaB [Sporosarcina luteola]|nr:tRNA threonylcarbamoyladenosine biosynthesis protein TsaB [Sporosarcina luteola]